MVGLLRVMHGILCRKNTFFVRFGDREENTNAEKCHKICLPEAHIAWYNECAAFRVHAE